MLMSASLENSAEVSLQIAWVFNLNKLNNFHFRSLMAQLRKLEPPEQKEAVDEIWTVIIFNLMRTKKITTIVAWYQELNSLNLSQKSRSLLNIEIQSKVHEYLAKLQKKLLKFSKFHNFQQTLNKLEKILKIGFDVKGFAEVFVLKFLDFVESAEINKLQVLEVLKAVLRFEFLDETLGDVYKALAKFGAKGHDKVVSIGQVLKSFSFESVKVLVHEGVIDQGLKVMIWRFLYSGIDEDLKIISQEIENLDKLQHANKLNPMFVDKLATYYDSSEVVVVQEYLPNTLQSFIDQSADARLMIPGIQELIQSYMYALNFGITHGAITPQCIFYNHAISESISLKINYAGSVLSRSKAEFNTFTAPEVRSKKQMSLHDLEKADAYSLGMVLLQCFTEFRIEKMTDFSQVYRFLLKIPEPEWIRDVISLMVKPDPEERANFNILQSKFPGVFTGFT